MDIHSIYSDFIYIVPCAGVKTHKTSFLKFKSTEIAYLHKEIILRLSM